MMISNVKNTWYVGLKLVADLEDKSDLSVEYCCVCCVFFTFRLLDWIQVSWTELLVYQPWGEVQPSARWTLGMITMNHLVCGGESSVNDFTMTLLGQSREPLRQQMATWNRHKPIKVADGVNGHPLSVSEFVCVCVHKSLFVCVIMVVFHDIYLLLKCSSTQP